MRSIRSRVALTLGVLGATGLAGAPLVPPSADAQRIVRKYYAPAPEAPEPAPLIVRDTPANLQLAFDSELNAKQRYVAFAQQADREGYLWVARLFRACARAEEMHANQHVHAIAWTGQVPRAMLKRLTVGKTAENLEQAVELETYEVATLYPALLERARLEYQTQAVRSLTFALSAEREHARLLAQALATLESRPPARAIHVCPRCGKTVVRVDFKKCPVCFTSARRFIQET